MKPLLSRVLLSLGSLAAVTATSVALATPAEAATYTTRCVVAREMRIYHTSTSQTPGRTKLYFGTTVYKDARANSRIRVYWWTLDRGLARRLDLRQPEVHPPGSVRHHHLTVGHPRWLG